MPRPKSAPHQLPLDPKTPSQDQLAQLGGLLLQVGGMLLKFVSSTDSEMARPPAGAEAAGPRPNGRLARQPARHVSPEEACELLGCSRRSLNRMVADSRLRAVRLSRRLRIDLASIEQLISEATR